MANDDIPKRPRLTSVSRGTGGGVSKLRNCKCFAEFDRRLRLGWSSSSLVKMIQDEYGELKEVSAAYLKKLIDMYRNSIPAAELSVASTNSTLSRVVAKRLSDGLDELSELERLYKMQMDRIEIDVGNEKKINKLFATTGREVFVAMKILRQSAELKMDLGLVKRQIGSVEVNGQLAVEATDRYGKDSIGRVLADPDSRRKVLGIAERLVALGAKASLDAVEMLGQVAQEQEEAIADDVTESPALIVSSSDDGVPAS